MKSFAFLLVLVLVSNLICVEAFDDVKCEKQLQNFEVSLEKRDLWALRCELA